MCPCMHVYVCASTYMPTSRETEVASLRLCEDPSHYIASYFQFYSGGRGVLWLVKDFPYGERVLDCVMSM